MSVSHSTYGPRPSVERVRVLVANDDPVAAEFIARQLRDLGHEVVGIAEHDGEILSAARSLAPDLVLLDIQESSETADICHKLTSQQPLPIRLRPQVNRQA